MRNPIIATLLLLVAGATQGRAQATPGPTTERAGILNTVLANRFWWRQDTTRVDGCSVFRALGEPAGYPAQVRPELRAYVTGQANPCASRPSEADRPSPHFVRVDSVTLVDTTATAFLHVVNGEQEHEEAYRVARHAHGAWYVNEVRLWGFVRVYRVRRQ